MRAFCRKPLRLFIMKLIQSLFIAAMFIGSVTLSVTRADDFKPEPGYLSLFNGTDLTGWGYPDE